MANSPKIKRHLDFAQGYAQLKMYDDAHAELEQVLRLSPDNLDALYWQGVLYLEEGKLQQAEAPFRRLIKLDPDQAHVYVHLAYIYRRTVSLEKAIETIERALQLKPTLPIALYNLSCYRAVEGKTGDSLKLLEQVCGLAKEYRELARSDPDFDSIRNLQEFRKLVEN